jgi:Acetoacetate decarboxylase (ADC)
MTQLIGHSFGDPPYHYDRAEELTVVFRTDADVLKSVLPPVLKPLGARSLAVARVMRHARSTFGPYIGVYLGAPAVLDDQPVFHLFSGLKTDFSGTVAGREVWGMPLQMGDVAMGWQGDVLNVVAGRRGVDFVRFSVRLECRAEPPTEKAVLGTFATRRQVFEKDSTDHVLIGLPAESDLSETKHWKASSVLKLVGGDPGDDWSIFPVHEIVETRYNTGGTTTLNRGVVLAEW